MYMGIRSLQHTKLAEGKNPSKVNVFRGCNVQSALPLGPRWAGGSLESHSDVFVCPRDQWLLPPPIVQQRFPDRQDPPQGGQWKVLSTTTTRVSSILTTGLPREQFGWDLLRVGPATLQLMWSTIYTIALASYTIHITTVHMFHKISKPQNKTFYCSISWLSSLPNIPLHLAMQYENRYFATDLRANWKMNHE